MPALQLCSRVLQGQRVGSFDTVFERRVFATADAFVVDDGRERCPQHIRPFMGSSHTHGEIADANFLNGGILPRLSETASYKECSRYEWERGRDCRGARAKADHGRPLASRS